MANRPEPELNPWRLGEYSFSHVPGQVVSTATELELFTHISKGQTTPAALAQAAGANERALIMLLDGLVALELLTKHSGTYALTPFADVYLVKGKNTYAGYFLEHRREILGAWDRLTQIVRTGQPPRTVESPNLTGFDGPLQFAPARPGEVLHSALDSRLATAVLGWHPHWELKAGLEGMVGAGAHMVA